MHDHLWVRQLRHARLRQFQPSERPYRRLGVANITSRDALAMASDFPCLRVSQPGDPESLVPGVIAFLSAGPRPRIVSNSRSRFFSWSRCRSARAGARSAGGLR